MTADIGSGHATKQSAPGIRLQNVSLNLGGKDIYRDLCLDIPGGRITCLLGPSGVGKSSLLKQIAGLVDGTGRIDALFGDRTETRPPVSFMGQTDLLAPWLSVIGNVTLGARLRGQKRNLQQATDLLKLVGLHGIENQRPDTLSGGMRQRVALARTLMESRRVVLMDEPFSAVDALTRRHLQDLAANLLRDTTVLLVTHDPWEAVRISHRIFVMGGPQQADLFNLPVAQSSTPRDEHDPASIALHGRLLDCLHQRGRF